MTDMGMFSLARQPFTHQQHSSTRSLNVSGDFAAKHVAMMKGNMSYQYFKVTELYVWQGKAWNGIEPV